MSPRARRGKIDGNHTEIVDALVDEDGHTVESLANVGNGCPDILVGVCVPRRGPREYTASGARCRASLHLNILIEIKNPEGTKRNLNGPELAWHFDWNGQAGVAENITEARAIIARAVEIAGGSRV